MSGSAILSGWTTTNSYRPMSYCCPVVNRRVSATLRRATLMGQSRAALCQNRRVSNVVTHQRNEFENQTGITTYGVVYDSSTDRKPVGDTSVGSPQFVPVYL